MLAMNESFEKRDNLELPRPLHGLVRFLVSRIHLENCSNYTTVPKDLTELKQRFY